MKLKETREGMLELRDDSGKVVARQKKNKPGRKPRYPDLPQRIDAKNCHQVFSPDGKLVWAQKGLNPDFLPHTNYPYNFATADQICLRIIEGATIRSLSKEPGFPPAHVIYYWMRVNDEFRSAIEECKRLRAEGFADEALETALSTNKKSDVAKNKLKHDALLKRAAIDDASGFGGESGSGGGAQIAIIVQTGVPDPEVEDEKPLKEVEYFEETTTSEEAEQ